MPPFKTRISKQLEKRLDLGLSRNIRTIEAGNTASLSYQSKSHINFSSNDYLGLAADKTLSQAWQRGIDLYGNGSGASPLVTGFSKAHADLEASLCDWLGFERAILFSSGFSANQAVLFSLMKEGDLLVQDKLNHASLIEAGIHCPAAMRRFRHNDIGHLKRTLTSSGLVVTEGVFSMDGDLAPLADIHTITQVNSWFMVDDAHGLGVLGDEGRGSCHGANVKPEILVVTFGKALGLSGAAVMCNQDLGDYFTQFARHHVYSTAMPPSLAHAISHSIEMVRTQQWRRDKLVELQSEYQQRFSVFDGYVETETPIKPFLIGDSGASVQIAKALSDMGLWLTAIRPPTVAKGAARLRITLTANHSVNQVRALANAVEQTLEKVA
ncbi:8-amino-7-oxononanoate synthase [Vibrio tetraodonis]|uniref:8-amino-7-oxononanoate synthase n=1 Tax=Vibrio tetraodonis TaxID=2231647 RepID=UPI000E0C6B98|nr:8-amino-7-oxononanoate synthase [Vibrio tetraodonis]